MINRPQILGISAMLAILFASRLFPHPANFTAIGAIAIFSGLLLRNKHQSVLFTLLAMLASDFLLELVFNTGFHLTMIFVYGALVLNTLIGIRIFKGSVNFLTIIGSSIFMSINFYVITNVGHWLMMGMYPMTFSGLIACLLAGVPFVNNDFLSSFALNGIIGDVFFSSLGFAIYLLVKRSSKISSTSGVSIG